MECYERTIICQHNEPPNNKSVQLNLFISHKAVLRKIPTKEGFTHDWMVMLTGDDGVKVHDIIEKVVFRLHPTFPNPKRGFKHPPYQLIESGYGGFNLPIDVHFKTEEEPKSIRFMYTLYLGITPSVSHRRCEKIIFQNPSRSFIEILRSSGATFLEPVTQTFPTNLFKPIKRPHPNENEFQNDHQIVKRPRIDHTIDNQTQQKYLPTAAKAPVKSLVTRKRGRPRKNLKQLDEDKENVGKSVQHQQDFKILKFNESSTPLSPVNNSQCNLSISMNSFVRNIKSDPSMSSTPISSRSILKKSSAPNKKSNLKLRFKSYVEEYSLGEDEKVILQENMHEYRKKLMESHTGTPLQSKFFPFQNHPNNFERENNASVQKNNDLVILQRTLMTITDKKVLKKVVKLIDEAGHLKMTQNSIDFDLCALDDVTLTKVRQCLYE